MSETTKMIEKNDINKMVNDIKNTLKRPTGYAKVLVGNFCVEIVSEVLGENIIEVKSIEDLRTSTHHGDIEFKNLIDKEYIKHVAKVSNGFNKHDNNIIIKFSNEANNWIEENGILDKLEFYNKG